MNPRPDNPLIVALDVSDVEAAETMARRLDGEAGILKVGLELFVARGPEAVTRLRAFAPVFLDVKLHDIPATVEGAARNGARLGIAMLTVHALGGEAMVAAAVRGATRGAEDAGHPTPIVLAVTVLSSLAGEGLASPSSLAFEAVSGGCERCRRVRRGRCAGPRGARDRGVSGRPGHPAGRLERSRSGPHPHTRGGGRTRRRLPRRRATDHGLIGSGRCRARDPRDRSLTTALRETRR